MQALGDLLSKNKSIVAINMENNNISDKGIEVLFSAILRGSEIQYINLSNNKGITDRVFHLMMDVIVLSKVQEIVVDGTSLTYQCPFSYLKDIQKQESRIRFNRRYVIYHTFFSYLSHDSKYNK